MNSRIQFTEYIYIYIQIDSNKSHNLFFETKTKCKFCPKDPRDSCVMSLVKQIQGKLSKAPSRALEQTGALLHCNKLPATLGCQRT